MKNDLSQLFDEAAPQELEQLLADTQAPALPRATIARIQKKVRSATHLQKKRPFPLRKLAAAAACLALLLGVISLSFDGGDGIVTRPGILTVTVYAADQETVYIASPNMAEHNAICVSHLLIWPYSNPFTFSVSEEQGDWQNVHFTLSSSAGGFAINDNGYHIVGTPYTIQNGGTVYWCDLEDKGISDNVVYIDAVVYSGENIIGYVVLRLSKPTCDIFADDPSIVVVHEEPNSDEESMPHPARYYCQGRDHLVDFLFTVEKIESVSFPKVDGEYQNISEEYVTQKLEEAKSN